jgi:hypothetical protein
LDYFFHLKGKEVMFTKNGLGLGLGRAFTK